ncbi:32301_t:CDS:2, partial [Racocetra persica]
FVGLSWVKSALNEGLFHLFDNSNFSDVISTCVNVNATLKSAHCETKNAKVMLKIIEANNFFSQNDIEIVVNELKIHCKVGSRNSNHPNICQIFGISEGNGTFMMVLQYANSGSLQDYLQSKMHDSIFEISWCDLVRIAKGIASGLEWLHCNEIVHRNLTTLDTLLNITSVKFVKNITTNNSHLNDYNVNNMNNGNNHRNVDNVMTVENINQHQTRGVWTMLNINKRKEFFDLPDECILEIFTYLNNVKDLYSCLFINKFLHQIAMSMLWRNPFVNNPKSRDSIILTYLNELNIEEQKTIIPLRINFPFIKSHSSKYAPYLETLDIHSLHIACLKWLAGAGYFCQCGELRIVQAVVSAIVQMIMRTNGNLKIMNMKVAEGEPDCTSASIFSSSQP